MEKLLDSLTSYIKAKSVLAKAAECCEHDHGYWLYNEQNAVDSYMKEALDELNRLIDSRVDSKLIQLGLLKAEEKCVCTNNGWFTSDCKAENHDF